MDKNRKTATAIVLVVLAMIGLSFAFVPLYRLFCQMTGYDGTTQISAAPPDKIYEREIDVFFDARTDSGLPWEFVPEKRRVKVKVGQQGMISFRATNLSARRTVGTALYNVTPEKSGIYFQKTQCFCFNEQVLEGGATAHFPVLFYIDPKILKARDMDDVSDMTLSYTFFAANSKNFEKAMEKYGQIEK
jgi:cytochrome c oxidase assembly protein subunit 11